ncbi:nicotinate-nucleotide adenylyltransferase [Algihabitans albus]|uniref:nicotinate-nucleotide adenylyltransferase n=1 Tax=Algihabitans albus TaxID=2164067 RepID=UPI000E5C6743|nr:nicotinate-nucleotide adenylyltransferase [Algihabitans albus]
MVFSRLRPPPFVTRRRLAAELGGWLPPPGARIGLLGGSFNPAHVGHLHISQQALKRLQLDEVWWLVSPQNPLKSQAGMARLGDRLAQAKQLARHPRLRITALERLLPGTLTADTLRALVHWFPGTRFAWLMGADNLGQIDRWAAWQEIFHTVGVAVLDRPAYSFTPVAGKAARRFVRARIPERSAGRLVLASPPAWTFLHIPKSALSATALRARAPSAIPEDGMDKSGPRGDQDEAVVATER